MAEVTLLPVCRPRPAIAAALAVLLAASARARPEASRSVHDMPLRSVQDAPLRSVQDMPLRSFHDMVADGWAQLPQRQDIAARQSVAAARFRAGGALVPDAPFVTGTYTNDKILGSNQNYLTTQVELSTPVWLPGEGTAMQNTARAEGAAAEAAGEAAHLALASELLDLATRAALADNARSVAARRLATSQALAADLARRFRVGEAAQSDALAADADAASAAVTLSSAETDLAALRAMLAEVTGSEALARLDGSVAVPSGPAAEIAPRDRHTAPARDRQDLLMRDPQDNSARDLQDDLARDTQNASARDTRGNSARDTQDNSARGTRDLLARHPRVVAAEQAVAAAEANEHLVRLQNRDDPQIGFQGIDEKQPGTRWDTRFGVVVRFSFATEARNAPRRATAAQATTQAMVQLALARREVLTEFRQAQVAVTGAERGRVAAERAASELERRRGQIDRAWRAGEMPLIEVVRANALAFDADYARDKARTALGAARIRVLLAAGVVP